MALFQLDINTVTANLTGKPAVSIPYGAYRGLPVGVQLMADSRKDIPLLEAARSLEGTSPVIGLEIHCQLTRLKSKLFCPCRADYRGMEPNTNVCPVCMGLPGTLPLLNRGAVRAALLIAMSLNCEPAGRLAFFRKNYFYPDLPKNFQITQYDVFGDTSVGGEGLGAGGRRGDPHNPGAAGGGPRPAVVRGGGTTATPSRWPTTTGPAFRWWRW